MQGVEETFLAGETIVRDGDPADRFYIIESGQVEETPFPHEADVHVLTIQAGDYFGEVGLLATRTRTATMRSVSEVRVISLDGAESRRSWRCRSRTRRSSAGSSTTGLVANLHNHV